MDNQQETNEESSWLVALRAWAKDPRPGYDVSGWVRALLCCYDRKNDRIDKLQKALRDIPDTERDDPGRMHKIAKDALGDE